MPNYNANTQVPVFSFSPATPPILDQGIPAYAFDNETPAVNQASQQFCLPASKHGVPKSVSVSISYAASPGAFEVDIETADDDKNGAGDANYAPELRVNSGLNASFVTRAELTNVAARWIRVRNILNTNGVALTVTITRHY
jgi:hypothetical protein